MKESNIIIEKSYQFAIRIVKLSKYLDGKKAFAISNQIIRCGTSIGANITEAQYAQSRKDFISKMQISLKEASETSYWINLLKDTNYIDNDLYISLIADCKELEKLLTSIIKTTKEQ